jgi:transposase-like protein
MLVIKPQDVARPPRHYHPALKEQVKAVRLRQKGWNYSEIARRLSRSPQTISNWWKRYRVDGIGGLKKRPAGPRSKDRLTFEEKRLLKRMAFGLRSSPRLNVKQLIEKLEARVATRFQKAISRRTLRRYLVEWGVSWDWDSGQVFWPSKG